MRAMVFEEVRGEMRVQNVDDPQLTPDGVIVKVMANGVCRSDWHGWVGDTPVPSLPFIFGHEFSGIVEEVGANVKQFKKGDRVIVPVNQSDNSCPYCLSGHQNLCDNPTVPGFAYNGGYAEYSHIPNADGNLIHLPESLDFVTGASLGCRFVTAYHGLIDQVKVQAGEWIAVFGAGGLGSSVIQIASALGAKVIAVDIGEEQLKLAKKLGARHTINSKHDNPVEAIQEITKGGADVSVDALGITETIQNALLSLGKLGRHLQLGVPSVNNMFTAVPIFDIFFKEIQIIGAQGMPTSRYPAMLNLIESIDINPGKLITNRISLDEAYDVIKAMDTYSTVGMTVVTEF